jgi:N-acetylneuraminate synthase
MRKRNKVKIIAEIGVNHNGNILTAKKLIRIAKKAGADFVKFQSFTAESISTEKTDLAEYQKKNSKFKSQYELLKKLELKTKDLKLLIAYAKKIKIGLLSTPFSIESLNDVISLGIKKIKIPSGEIDNYQLLEAISKKATSIILSTGMATLKEINFAVKILKKKISKKKITILHCTSDYPTEPENVNMNFLITLKKYFKINIGYSDHTKGIEAGILATALGSKIIEKHLTLDRELIGPDHSASLNPKEFANYVRCIRLTEQMLGSDIKKITSSEIKTKKLVRKSIVAKTFIRKGEKFNENNITCKRPQSGIKANQWKKLMDKKAKKNFTTNQFIEI